MNNNDKITLWMGRPCSCEHGWEDSERHAIELLAAFPEHGLGVGLESRIAPDGWGLTVFRDGAEWFTFEAPTIAKAVCRAVMQIIEPVSE